MLIPFFFKKFGDINSKLIKIDEKFKIVFSNGAKLTLRIQKGLT